MMSTEEYIRTLQKEIQRQDKLIKFYEEIILSNEELRETLKEYKKYYGNKDRRNNGEKKWQKR